MDNFLDNGTVLPSGLLGISRNLMAGFNKNYKNTSLRIGVVVKAFSISDEKNLSKLATEYDVQVFEQNEDYGSTIITYRNCLSTDSLGSIADFFEKNLRVRTGFPQNDEIINTTDQNGAVVLIQCVDGVSEKAMIVGGVNHPDRATTLTDTLPRLQGTYNGINIAVNPDGSSSLTFNGATDNDGEVINESQKSTTMQIADDGAVTVLTAASSMLSMTNDGSVQILTANGNTVFLNNASNQVSVTQKDGNTIGMTSSGITIANNTGAQIVHIGSNIQLTSGSDLIEQSATHTIDSGAVTITGAGGVKLKDQIGGELNIKNGQVALGGPQAEVLSLFNQVLQSFISNAPSVGLTGVGPAALNPSIIATLSQVSALLSSITGTL